MTQFRYYLQPGFHNTREIELFECAKTVVDTCLNVRSGETVAIVSDSMQSVRLAESLCKAVNDAGADYVVAIIKPRKSMYGPPSETDPPSAIKGLLEYSDAALLVGTTGIIWSEAAQNALRKGTRILSAPGVSEDNFARCVCIDYDAVWASTRRIQDILTKGKSVTITSPQGTYFEAEPAYVPKWECDGRVSGRGDFDFLPTGFAQCGLKEGSGEGTIVIDGAFSRIGVLTESIAVHVKGGKIVSSAGGFERLEFERLLSMYDDPMIRHISAFTLGTNPNAKFTGQPNEDERVCGMMCFFLGDNSRIFGGRRAACMYLMATLTAPKVEVDRITVVEGGRLMPLQDDEF